MRSVNLLFAVALLVLVPQFGYAGPLVNGNFADGFTGWTDYSTSGLVSASCELGGYYYDKSYLCLTFASFAASQQPGPPQYAIELVDHNGTETAQTTGYNDAPPPAPAIGSPVISPSGNASFAFISNVVGGLPPGENRGGGASLSQTFTASPKATDLIFNIDFLTVETGLYASPDALYSDLGGVVLLDGTTVLDEVDLAGGGYNSYPQAPVLTPGGEAGGFPSSSGWIHEDFDIAGLAGDALTLEFFVVNNQDNGGESRVLIDDVREVPEPPSAWMMFMGLVGFLTWRISSRSSRRVTLKKIYAAMLGLAIACLAVNANADAIYEFTALQATTPPYPTGPGLQEPFSPIPAVFSVNNSGSVLVTYHDPITGWYQGFLDAQGNFSFFSYYPVGSPLFAYAINDNGVIVGSGPNPVQGRMFPTVFTYSNGTETLATPPGVTEQCHNTTAGNFPNPGLYISYPTGINDQGVVIGWGISVDCATIGFVYSGGADSMILDPNAAPLPFGYTPTPAIPYAINNSGAMLVAELADNNNPYLIASPPADFAQIGPDFLYSGGTFNPIPGTAVGITDNGDIYGYSGFWNKHGNFTSIEGPDGKGIQIEAVSSNGRYIAGYYTDGSGDFLATIPEPSTLWIFGTSFVLIIGFAGLQTLHSGPRFNCLIEAFPPPMRLLENSEQCETI